RREGEEDARFRSRRRAGTGRGGGDGEARVRGEGPHARAGRAREGAHAAGGSRPDAGTARIRAVRFPSLLLAAALAAGSASGQTVALVGGTIHPVSGPDVENGTVLLRDGKIAALGAGLAVPAGAKVVDIKGRHVYPSLFTALTALGLVEISSVRATVDTTELGEINPQARADFAMNFDSELLPVARSAGILVAGIAPSGGIVSGSLAVMKLDGWTREDAALKAPAAIIVRWPDLT